MRWFRDHIRQGAWAALIALAINVALSFGHVHAPGGEGRGAHSGLLVTAVASSEPGQNQGHPEDGQSDYLCPICVAAAAVASALASTPPAVSIELTAATIKRPLDRVLALATPQRAAFQSRGPPVS
jgi:DUF2946 family protein